jgi:MoaA/NifB/PqqE/SkfB family radical SAM enzyme
MAPETFEQSLERAIEFRSVSRSLGRPDFSVGFCGLGEPLLNRHVPAFVGSVRAAGFDCNMSTNGALLDERKSHALLQAGLQQIKVNIGEVGEAYEQVYKLPFERALANVLRFKELARDQCEVVIVLVDHRDEPRHLERTRQYWRDHGITRFQTFGLINRGGALPVERMRYESSPEAETARALLEDAGVRPVCAAPFLYLFIGYDGQYYLDSSDWRKDVPLGSVFEVSFVDILAEKLAHVRSREPICKSCSLDPTNRVADALRRNGQSSDSDEVRDAIERTRNDSAFLLDHIQAFLRSAAARPGTEPLPPPPSTTPPGPTPGPPSAHFEP